VWGGSRRKIALACERTLACLAMGGPARPDCRTSRDLRTRHLEACQDVVVPVVRRAAEAGLGPWGSGATAGPNLQGNASRPQAMSSGERQKAGERRREDLATVGPPASPQAAADAAAWGRRRGEALPAEWPRRADRVARSAAARRRGAAQAQAAAAAERQRRAAAAAARHRPGQPRRGQAPAPVEASPDATAQRKCTEPARPRLRPHNTGGADCGNAPARVAGACQRIGACDVPDAANEKPQAEPRAQAPRPTLAPAGLARPQAESGPVPPLPATGENGSESAAAVVAREPWGCAPSSAIGRQRHPGPQAAVPAAPATAQERRAATVQTPAGQAGCARRQVSVEPGCGQSKEARGVRRCLRRGWASLRGAWRLGGLTQNLRTIWRSRRVRSVAEALGAQSLGVPGAWAERCGVEEPPCHGRGTRRSRPLPSPGCKEPAMLMLGQAPRQPLGLPSLWLLVYVVSL
jgi:Transposase DDE domain